jgi:hypothetical protein
MKHDFLDRFSKNTQIPNFMKIHPVGVKMFHADGLTDIIKLIVSFWNFASAPKNHSGKPFVTFSLSPHILTVYQMVNVKKLPVVDTQRTWKQRNPNRDEISEFCTPLTIISGLRTMFGNTSH